MPDPIRPIVFDPQVIDEPGPCFNALELRHAVPVKAQKASGSATTQRRKHRSSCPAWSAETLHEHLRNVLRQVDKNLRAAEVPTAKKFDDYVRRLCSQLQDFLASSAPRREEVLPVLVEHFGFWDFELHALVEHNEEPVTPEQLRSALEGVLAVWPMRAGTPAKAGPELRAEDG